MGHFHLINKGVMCRVTFSQTRLLILLGGLANAVHLPKVNVAIVAPHEQRIVLAKHGSYGQLFLVID